MLLVDTNIWLELLLEQERADEVRLFLNGISSEQIAISHFSLHSVGVILGRYKRYSAIDQFIHDLFVDGSVQLVTLVPQDFGQITHAMNTQRLDFDDAYQYVAARKIEARLVSFDADFDRTDLRRLTPAEAMLLSRDTE